jgi:hypothetical protein
MVNLPIEVMAEINENPKASKIIGTKADDGSVHMIPVGSVRAANPTTIMFGAILMNKTSKNLEGMKKRGEAASVLIMDPEKRSAYEVKAKVKDYQTVGPAFDRMNENVKKMGLTLRGVWILEPTEVWNQSASYEAGKRIL